MEYSQNDNSALSLLFMPFIIMAIIYTYGSMIQSHNEYKYLNKYQKIS